MVANKHRQQNKQFLTISTSFVVTNVAFSLNLTRSKISKLKEIADKLGQVRAEVWNKYGSLKAWSLKSILAYKDFKLKHPPEKYGLPSKLWERTITNVVDDIHASQCAAKEKVIKYIYRNYTNDKERTRLCKLLDTTEWLSHPKLHKWMRKAYKRGHTKVNNQIIYTPNEYTTFERNGKTWINVQSLERGKRIAIPLNSQYDLAGKNLRLIIRNERVEVHFAVFQEITPPINDNRPCAIGIDRGVTEVYVTSNEEFIGTGLGEIITTESEYRNIKGYRRNKLRAIAQKAKAKGNIALVKRIEQNNLGKKKWDYRERKFKGKIKTLAYTAAHQVCKQAKKIVYEDLTDTFSSKKVMSKKIKRSLSTWTKGIVIQALKQVSVRRSSTLVKVNAAYTSQMDHRHGVLLGTRNGDSFYCFDGVVLQADTNAAKNVLARLSDAEITTWMTHNQVKFILAKRTEQFSQSLRGESQILDGSVEEQLTLFDISQYHKPNQKAKHEKSTDI